MTENARVSTAPVRVAVIPAGGLGTRLLPVTKTVPKEMLPLVDVPVIEIIIESAVRSGVDEVVVVSAPGKQPLDAYFQAAPSIEQRLRDERRDDDLARVTRPGRMARVTVVHQEEPRGNGHAVLCARRAVGDRPFVMLWADDIVVADPPVAAQLIAVRERMGGGSVAGAMRVRGEDAKRYGIVEGEPVDDRTWRVRRIVEKPAQPKSDIAVVHGYVLEPEVFDILERLPPGARGEIWLTDAVNELAQRAPVYAHLFAGDRYDVGDRAGYVQATIALALARPELRAALEGWLRQKLGR